MVRFTVLVIALLTLAAAARAQAPLYLVDEDTQVREISFRGNDTIDEARLREQMALSAPGFFYGVREFLPFMNPPPHPFDPIVLQKDIVRLRKFYARHGFLEAEIGYPASQLDTTDNDIHIILRIEEGPPLIVQDVNFFAPDSQYARSQFTGNFLEEWEAFRDEITLRAGERFTEFEYLRLQGEVAGFLRNRGFAFATVEADSTVDRSAHTIDVRLDVDAGPRGYVEAIAVEGAESVDEEIVRREMPFSEGDPFRQQQLVRGQRELFALNLFRVALVDVPEDQPRDSTVVVRARVREAEPRYVTAQTGYSGERGVGVEGQWSHRNFLGGARNFTAAALFNTGYGAFNQTEGVPDRELSLSLSFRQPYLFITQLAGVVTPFYRLQEGGRFDGREVGATTQLIYEPLPYRALTLKYTYARALSNLDEGTVPPAGEEVTAQERDIFNRSILTLSGTLGDVDDFVAPSRGYLLRPFVEGAGSFLASAIQYSKGGIEGSAYRPVSDAVTVALRINAGRMLLIGDSKYNEAFVYGPAGTIPDPEDRILENRFDPIRFYAGGASDVRGWGPDLLGPKVAQADYVRDSTGVILQGEDGLPLTENEEFEPLGGLSKLTFNLETRMPFPGLGEKWSSAVFLDGGQIGEGRYRLSNLRFGTGLGMRYETVVGFIRLDLAYKVNPTYEDLRDPRAVFLLQTGAIERGNDLLDPQWTRRFALHLSIGQAF